MRQPDKPMVSTISLLPEYLEQVWSARSAAVIPGTRFIISAPEWPLPRGVNETRISRDEAAMRSRRERHDCVIAMLDKWLADDSGYDEATWPHLKKQIEESRTSKRRRFSE